MNKMTARLIIIAIMTVIAVLALGGRIPMQHALYRDLVDDLAGLVQHVLQLFLSPNASKTISKSMISHHFTSKRGIKHEIQ